MTSWRRTARALASRALDAFVIVLALQVGTALHGVPWTERYTIAGVLAILLFHLFAEGLQLYRSWRGTTLNQSLQPVLAAWLCAGLGLAVLAWSTKTTADYSRVAAGLWMLLALVSLMGWRMLGRLVLGAAGVRGGEAQRVAIVGANDDGARFAQVLKASPELGLTLVGFFDDRSADAVPETLGAPVLGDCGVLVEHARAHRLDGVWIALPMKEEERIGELITKLSDTPASVYVVPPLFVHDLAHARWIDVGPVPAISVFESPYLGINGWLKRAEDLVLSVLALTVAALPMLAVAAAVRLTSPGPALFRQRRYGLDGREFAMWKFRTMTVLEDGDDVVQARRQDTRVTPLGAFLRRTSLDELPQLFNVLRGDMSMVGPRPHAVVHNEHYRHRIPGYMLRHRIRPGITGWAQVNGWRGETDTLDKMEHRVEFDLWYIRSWSLWLDLRIIARTTWRVLADKGAW